MNKTYRYSRSSKLIAGIFFCLAVGFTLYILLTKGSFLGLVLPALLAVTGLHFVSQPSLTWQVDDEQIVQRDNLGRETSLRWADLRCIRSNSNNALYLESFDGAHIDLHADLPGFSEIVEFTRRKRADLWQPVLQDGTLSSGNDRLVLLLVLILGTIGAAVYLFFQSIGPSGFSQSLIGFLAIFLAIELHSLYYYPYGHTLKGGVLHLKYWPAKDLFFKPADISDVQIITSRSRNHLVINVSIRTQDGKTIRLANGSAHLYGVLKAWKDAS